LSTSAAGYGQVSIALANRHPLFRFVVQDRPETVSDGSSKLPAELTDRVTFMAHDFFTEQPIKGADVFLLRWILHDWSDKYAIKILRALAPALKPGVRILINEAVIPEPGVLSPFDERSI
jgi:chemotaxis methyl-accepting protein methylase